MEARRHTRGWRETWSTVACASPQMMSPVHSTPAPAASPTSSNFSSQRDRHGCGSDAPPRTLGYAGGINAWLAPLLELGGWKGAWILNPDTTPEAHALAALVMRAETATCAGRRADPDRRCRVCRPRAYRRAPEIPGQRCRTGRRPRDACRELARAPSRAHRHGQIACRPTTRPTRRLQESGGACRSDYATDRRSTGLALTPAFRATVMTSVAMDMPMRLLGT